MTWHQQRMCAFDVESTGTDIENDRIVTAAIVSVTPDGVDFSKTLLINPGVEIPEGATAVHGITNEHAQANGLDARAGIATISSILARAVKAGVPLVAMNARFDLTMLDRECRRHGIPVLNVAAMRVIDPLVIDKHVDRYRRGGRKLVDLCAHYGARLDDAHEATADALAAARIAWRLAATTSVGRMTLTELHDNQIVWAAEQAAGLSAYFARQGKPEHVEPQWPVIDVPAAVAA